MESKSIASGTSQRTKLFDYQIRWAEKLAREMIGLGVEYSANVVAAALVTMTAWACHHEAEGNITRANELADSIALDVRRALRRLCESNKSFGGQSL